MRSLPSPCLALDSRLGPTTALSGQGLFHKLGRGLHNHEVLKQHRDSRTRPGRAISHCAFKSRLVRTTLSTGT